MNRNQGSTVRRAHRPLALVMCTLSVLGVALRASHALAQLRPYNDPCTSDSQCPKGFICAQEISTSDTKHCVDASNTCQSDRDCPKGLACFSTVVPGRSVCEGGLHPMLAARPTNQGQAPPPCHSNADCPKHFECGQPAGDQCLPLWIKCTSRADCDPDEFCEKGGSPPDRAGRCTSRRAAVASTCLTNDDCPDRETCVMMREAWRGGTCTPVAGAQ